MIKYLASSIRSIPDENSSQLENQGATNEVDENAACVDKTPHNQVLTIIDQKLQKIANMATAAIDSPNENSPLQDEENPQVIGVPTVVQMFQELKEEIRALANQQHQCKAEVDVETLKSECCNKVEAALTIALKDDIEVVQKTNKKSRIYGTSDLSHLSISFAKMYRSASNVRTFEADFLSVYLSISICTFEADSV